MNDGKKIVKLVSGGVDSFIMSKEFPGINVYVDFGQNYAKEEKEHLDKLDVKYDIISVASSKVMNTGNNIYIPNRNLTLVCLVATLYNPDIIYVAGLKDDNCVDKTEDEFDRMSTLISRYMGKKISIESPYWNKTKGDIIHDFKDKQLLINTFSCYSPIDGKPCLGCPACLRRIIALETNGIEVEGVLSEKILKEYMKKIHTYDSDRISRFFIYLKNHYKMLTCDIDGILCENTDDLNFIQKKPISKNIEKFNNFQGLHILYTTRLELERSVTEKWLAINNVKYDCLIMNKLPYTLFIDDQTQNNF